MAAPTRVRLNLIEVKEWTIIDVAASTTIYKGWLVSEDAGGDLIEALREFVGSTAGLDS